MLKGLLLLPIVTVLGAPWGLVIWTQSQPEPVIIVAPEPTPKPLAWRTAPEMTLRAPLGEHDPFHVLLAHHNRRHQS